MQRIVVVGGGVGGTLVANLLARKLGPRRSTAARSSLTVVDPEGAACLPARLHVHRHGQPAPRGPASAPSAASSTSGSGSRSARSSGSTTDGQLVELSGGERLAYDQLILATGSRIVPELIRGFAEEAHHFYGAGARAAPARCARRVQRRQDRDRDRGHAVQVPAGAAGGRVPDRVRAPRARACARRARSTSARPSAVRSRSRASARWPRPILAEKGIELHTFFNVETIDRERKVISLEGEELPYDLLILVPPHRGAQFLIDSGFAPAPGGWLPTDKHTLEVGGRATSTPWVTPPTCPSRRPDRPRTSRRRSWRSGSRRPSQAASRTGRHASYTGQGDVLLRGRRREGHPAPVRLRPPAQAADAEPALAPGQDRVQQDVLAHGSEGPRLARGLAPFGKQDGGAGADPPGLEVGERR